jgi:hypothetical protein
MIVVVILALVATGTTFAIGALTRTTLKSACMKIVAASRFAYNHAIVRHKTVRLRIDADTHKMSLQQAHGRVVLASADNERRQEIEEDKDSVEAAVDPWEAAKANLEKSMEPSFGRSPFEPIKGRGGHALDKYKPQPIGDGVRVVKMFLPHERDPRDRGKGAIHFFPNGMAQRAVIQLSDDDGETVYSVEIHPLTGRGKVYDEAYEPEDLGEEDFSELEDPI